MVLTGYLLVLMSQDRNFRIFIFLDVKKSSNQIPGKGKTVEPLVGTTLPAAQRNITEVGFQNSLQLFDWLIPVSETQA